MSLPPRPLCAWSRRTNTAGDKAKREQRELMDRMRRHNERDR